MKFKVGDKVKLGLVTGYESYEGISGVITQVIGGDLYMVKFNQVVEMLDDEFIVRKGEIVKA